LLVSHRGSEVCFQCRMNSDSNFIAECKLTQKACQNMVISGERVYVNDGSSSVATMAVRVLSFSEYNAV